MRVGSNSAAWMRTALLASTLFLGVLAPAPIAAQEAAAVATIPEISDESLMAFANAFLEISAVRDEINNELGRVHDAQGKAAIRARLEERIAEILTRHEIDAKQFQRLLYYVSAEPALRERFDRAVETIKAKASGESETG